MVPLAGLARSGNIAFKDLGRHFAGNTRRAHYQTLVITLQILAVGTGSVIVAVHPRAAHQLNQVLVTAIVFGQHDKVVAGVVAGVLVLVFLAAVGHIHLAPEDRLERLQPFSLALLVHRGAIVRKFLDAIHHAMVRNGHAAHAVADGFVHQVGHFRLSIEYRIVRMYVQMHKIFHSLSVLER